MEAICPACFGIIGVSNHESHKEQAMPLAYFCSCPRAFHQRPPFSCAARQWFSATAGRTFLRQKQRDSNNNNNNDDHDNSSSNNNNSNNIDNSSSNNDNKTKASRSLPKLLRQFSNSGLAGTFRAALWFFWSVAVNYTSPNQ